MSYARETRRTMVDLFLCIDSSSRGVAADTVRFEVAMIRHDSII